MVLKSCSLTFQNNFKWHHSTCTCSLVSIEFNHLHLFKLW
jgi:hypothetical protein